MHPRPPPRFLHLDVRLRTSQVICFSPPLTRTFRDGPPHPDPPRLTQDIPQPVIRTSLTSVPPPTPSWVDLGGPPKGRQSEMYFGVRTSRYRPSLSRFHVSHPSSLVCTFCSLVSLPFDDPSRPQRIRWTSRLPVRVSPPGTTNMCPRSHLPRVCRKGRSSVPWVPARAVDGLLRRPISRRTL